MENTNTKVDCVRCDNASENVKLEKLCLEQRLKVQFEYTARDTPQHNGVVERSYQTLYNKVRAMLNGAGIKNEYRQLFWVECASTATKLENIVIKKGRF